MIFRLLCSFVFALFFGAFILPAHAAESCLAQAVCESSMDGPMYYFQREQMNDEHFPDAMNLRVTEKKDGVLQKAILLARWVTPVCNGCTADVISKHMRTHFAKNSVSCQEELKRVEAANPACVVQASSKKTGSK